MFEILLMILLSIPPGYAIVTLLDKRLDDTEKFALSLGVSFIFFGSIGLLLHILGYPLAYSLFFLVPLAGISLLRWKRFSFVIDKKLLLILLLAFVLRFGLQFLFSAPFVGDSYFHMDLARTFTTPNWFSVNAIDNLWSGVKFPFPEEYRPPFFNFVMGFFFQLFGTSFEIAKFLNVIIGTIAIVPIYLVAKQFSNQKIALLVSFFMAVNPLMIAQSLEAEVRIFTVYLAFISFYFFVKAKNMWLYSGLFLGLLYITHYAPGTILALTYFAYLVFYKRELIFQKSTLFVILSFFLIVSPWLVRNFLVFGDPLYTSSRYATLMDRFDQILLLKPPTIQSFFGYILNNPSDFIFSKVTNIYRSLFPLPFQSRMGIYFLNLDPTKNFNLIGVPISMIVTLPIFILSLFYFSDNFKKFRKPNLLFIYVIVGFLFSFTFWSFRIAFTYNFLFQQLILISIAGFIVLNKVKSKYKKLIYVLVAVALLIQLSTYYLRLTIPADFAQSWIVENTNPNDTIMARWTNVHVLNLFTDRKILSMPYENEDTVIQFAKTYNVTYIIIDRLDLDTQKVSVDSMTQKLQLVATYKVPEPRFSQQYVNTYWIFKV